MANRFAVWTKFVIRGIGILVLMLSVNFAMTNVPVRAATASTEVVIHYYRFDHQYTGWDLWLWPFQPQNLGGAGYAFTGQDSYGVYADAFVPGNNTQVGFIVREGGDSWTAKDVSQDRFINVTNGRAEVWLVEGNPNVYSSQSAALAAAQPSVSNAFLDGANTALIKLNSPVNIAGSSANFSVLDKTSGQMIPVTGVQDGHTAGTAVLVGDLQTALGGNSNWSPSDNTTRMTEVSPGLFQYTGNLPAGSYLYKVALNGTWDQSYPSSNVSLSVPAGGAKVTFTYLSTTQQVFDTINNPSSDITVAGDFQHLLGGNDWDPGSSVTHMKAINPDLYQFTASLPAGTFQYKVTVGGSWSVNYPGSNVSLPVPAGGADVTFSYVPSKHQVFDSINNPNVVLSNQVKSDLVKFTLASNPNVTHTLQVQVAGYTPGPLMPRDVLDLPQYTYTGDDLGSTFTPTSTSFRVWAPTASDMQLLLYNSEQGPLTQTVPMQRSDNGTWYATVQGNLSNWYYLYQVTIDGQTQTAVDPYADTIAVNGSRGMVVDLANANPPGWPSDTHVSPQSPEDAVIYEVHVRDFSIDPNSGSKYPGLYLAFTEHGTNGPGHVATGVDSLKQLGVTDVQLQPVEEFNSIDETLPNQYNWGYDPRNYNVPEGAYATTPHGTARITEFKSLVEALHNQKMGIIMDVVYNHTFATKVSDFDTLVPYYYYRTDDAGNYTNGSGVGNEFATERPMAQKFVLDSVKYWVTQYHVDGFRFDLMALLGTNTMEKVSQELHALNPGVLIYGEPWTGGSSGIVGDTLLTKGQQQGLGIGVFNDNLRNALDGNVFDASAQGFATGASGEVGAIENGVVGSINYNSSIHDFTAQPSETINYVTSHDNYTLWDKIALSNPSDSEANRILMDELAQAVVFTSQGVPFMQGGEEMLRTKGGNGNSYNAGDAVNEFDWSRKSQYNNVFNYYAGMIHLREAHPAFRMTSTADIQQHLQFLPSPANTVEYELTNHANGDAWSNIVVIYNPGPAATFSLPVGQWNVVATQGKVGYVVQGQDAASNASSVQTNDQATQPAGTGDAQFQAIGQAQNTVSVPAMTCEILYQTN